MKVLVTGAHGTVGTAVTEHLDSTVADAVADRPNPPDPCATQEYEFVLLEGRILRGNDGSSVGGSG